jgi:hypothetical protein
LALRPELDNPAPLAESRSMLGCTKDAHGGPQAVLGAGGPGEVLPAGRRTTPLVGLRLRPLVVLLLVGATAPAWGAEDPAMAAVRLLGKPRAVRAAVLKPWPSAPSPDHWLVAGIVNQKGDDQDEVADLWVGLLVRRAAGLAVVARLQVNDIGNPPEGSSFEVNFDLAPYQISPTERAIGVRVTESYRSTEHSSTTTTLHLLRFAKGDLTDVLATTVSDGGGARDDDGNRRESPAEEYILIMAKTQTAGFFDIVVRNRKTKEKVATWTWAGSAYQEQKARPAKKSTAKPGRR